MEKIKKIIKLKCNPLIALLGGNFDEVKIYETENPKRLEFDLKSKSDSVQEVRLSIRGEDAYFKLSENVEMKDWTVSLNPEEKLPIPIYIKPGKIGDRNVTIEATTKFSLTVKKNVTITTKKSTPPIPKLEFNLSDGNKYYVNEGKRKIGELTVTASGDSPNSKAYGLLDLDSLTCSCELVKLEPLDEVPSLPIGESKIYNVWFECNEEKEINFRFSIGEVRSKSYSIDIKKQKDPISSVDFVEKDNLYYDDLKENHLVGHLETVVVGTDKRGYFKRKNGFFELTDRIYSFDKEGKVKKQKLEYGKNSYPIYVDVKDLFGSIKDNIDEDKTFQINALFYSDSITKEKNIASEYSVRHIVSHPVSSVSILENSGKEYKIENQSTLTLDEWKYDSIVASQFSSGTICAIKLSNKQRLAYNGNGVIWKDISISGDDIVNQSIPSFEIRNGGESITVQVKVIFDKIRDKSQINILLKCNEIINDADTDAISTCNIHCDIIIPIKEIIVDDWYSIDLGTTGIVVAKWNYAAEDDGSYGISPIELDDKEKPIESSKNIVSSITILKPSSNDEGLGEILVAPSTTEFNQSAKYVLVPTKFMVGQNILPFVNTYMQTFSNGLLMDGKKYDWKNVMPKDILEYTYKTIFSKISKDECNRVRKLIITYPNTYTPQSLDWLRQIIISSNLFKNLSAHNLHLIPESDSVVAYYIKKSMERETNKDSERVVIYDMGAGTLDLSYVNISVNLDNGKRTKKAIIEKRIGIPIAGEYFSYLIYEHLKGKFTDDIVSYTTKTWVENLKMHYKDISKYSEVPLPNDEKLIKQECADEKIELGEAIDKWIRICTEEAFVQLLGRNWSNEVERIVLSGRGSQFKPIHDKLTELVKGHDIILDFDTIQKSELKQCVAEGAILYQQIFENPFLPFSILHRNSYERIGMRYCILDEHFTRKWVYKELMNESDLIWDESPKDGAIFAQVLPKVVRDLDFRIDGDVIFYLTTLDESEMVELFENNGAGKEAFVNELFRFKSQVLSMSGNRERCMLSLGIDTNNVLSISINSMDLLPHSTLPNVEDDKFYVKCNWYFSNK